MSDLLGLYLAVFAAWLTIVGIVFVALRADLNSSRELGIRITDREQRNIRRWAIALLAAPVWPLVLPALVVLGIRVVVRTAIHGFSV